MPDAPASSLKSHHLTHSIEALQFVQEMRRRLVICLDGTWNARDSGTNIYHLANLVQDGIVPAADGEWNQIVYYDPGVGTGVLDGVTGGAFGIGLSENVREAYDWLVEKYRDGDEVYIFGFSRGAFTARSLAGLIAKCGLLSRGAPMPPSELWNAYRLLGRFPNPATASQPPKYWWERVLGPKRPPFRRISELKADGWPGGDRPPNESISPPPNESERLLCTWSRRIQITCLGVCDTVASLGVDALAIPWLTERTAQFHDTQLSSIIQNGFQALAIDEHRANFKHIPWLRPVTTTGPQRQLIEQRWFAGAHSNIGGSYEDDLLAQYPLSWMIQRCRDDLHLVFRAHPHDPDPGTVPPAQDCLPLLLSVKSNRPGIANQSPHLRDSFAELGHGIWRGLIRSKPEYRRIQPNDEFQNSILVRSENEIVDESVWRLLELEQNSQPPPRYNPVNLWRAAHAKFPNLPRPKHRYLEDASALRWFLGWLLGLGLVGGALALATHSAHPSWIIAGVIAAAILVDWSESVFNFRAALVPEGFRAERFKALTSFCLFVRLLLLSALGLTIPYWLVKIWPWIFLHDRDWHILWLIAFNCMVLYCTATAAWCATPMWDAGYGEILPLQFAFNPARVLACLRSWMSKAKASRDKVQLRLPIAHTLWRDMLGYIPAYTSFIFFGCWFTLSVWGQQFLGHGTLARPWYLFSPDPFSWKLAGAIALAYAVGDYLEDIIHLSHLRRYPKPPFAVVVLVGCLGTALKFIFGFAGWIGIVLAMGWLVLDQVPSAVPRDCA